MQDKSLKLNWEMTIMSNNRYKNAFNQIEVSDRAIDNLYDIAKRSKEGQIMLQKRLLPLQRRLS